MDKNSPEYFINKKDFAGLCKYLSKVSWRTLPHRKILKCQHKAYEIQREISRSNPAKRFSDIIDDMCVQAQKQARKNKSLYSKWNHTLAIDHLRDEWLKKYGKFREIENELTRIEMMKFYAKKYRKEFNFNK